VWDRVSDPVGRPEGPPVLMAEFPSYSGAAHRL